MKTEKNGALLLSVILIALCLRAPITGVGSLLSAIAADVGLGSGAAGMLTTIPLLAFAALSLPVGGLSVRFGAGRVMLCGLVILCVGMLCRSLLGAFGLFAGSAVIGVGIAIGNVLLPAFIKAYFPAKMGLMTALYTTVMSVLASISGGVSVPVASALGWRGALMIWVVLSAVALVFWIPRRGLTLSAGGAKTSGASLARFPMTWAIAFYMGVQSLLFYSFVAWFATIMQSNGFSPETAGYLNSAFMLMGLPGSFLIPIIGGRLKNQSVIGVGLGLIYIVGMSAMLFSQRLPFLVVAVVCCGFCTGACIGFSMTLFGLHTASAADASRLSGLAQSVGYLLAAAGPTLTGKLYDLSGGWTLPLCVLLALTLVLTVLGYLVGREKIIGG